MLTSVSKAAIVQDGHLLLQRCVDTDGIVYFELPGGVQAPMETMEEAALRQCREMTGYPVAIDRFLALQEEIMVNPVVREAYPEHAHRVFHVFLCHIVGEPGVPVVPQDSGLRRAGFEWTPLGALAELTVRPQIIQLDLVDLLHSGHIGYRSANRIDTFFPQP